MHALVVGDGDPFHRYRELGGQCRAIRVPGRRGDDDVDVGKSERGLLEAVAATWAPAAANCSSIAADPLNRSTLRASSSPTVARKFSPSSGMFTQCTRPSPKSSSLQSHNSAAPTGENGKCSLIPRPGLASLATTRAQLMVCDRRNPSMICKAVRTPQVPFEMSKENVPWASSCGSSGLAPMSSWMSAARAGSRQILVAVDAGIDQKVHVVGLSARSLQTGLGRRDRQMQCAVTGAPTYLG